MKTVVIFLAAIIVACTIGFFIGKSQGKEEQSNIMRYRSIESVKKELLRKEQKGISQFLKGNAKIETKNEGSFFKKKYVKYFSGKITNNALLAKAKDVKVKVRFLSKTKSEIGSTEFTIYEFINPNASKSFRKRISVAEDVAEFKWNILGAKFE